jgi:hypothetical protein
MPEARWPWPVPREAGNNIQMLKRLRIEGKDPEYRVSPCFFLDLVAYPRPPRGFD